MVYYKINSLTSTLGKRHSKKNVTLDIEYREKFTEKKYKLTPNGTLYISSPSLPANLHKLRMKKLITISEISKNAFLRLQNSTPIPVVATTTTTIPPKKTRKTRKTSVVNEEKE